MAQGPPGYLRVLFEHYDNWSREASERWARTVQDSQDGTLDTKKVVGDWIYLAAEGVKGVWAPFLVTSGGMLRIHISVGLNDAEKEVTVPVAGDSTKTLTNTLLKKVGGAKTILANKVEREFVQNDSVLRVKLKNLDTGQNFAVDEKYEGTISLDGEIFAVVRAIITP